ncbi:hypothetical protein ACVIHI_001916 [Bradyrhizobium sp. USDA 4524]|uniref:hypothetical protein n=1 Tax=Bradyrhizobium TaxID=374 RepID=UPI0020A19DD1|nr:MULTISPECIES: hypothetical protein [Bradyrhizobium]MCP1845163.1 hypothetical protein [Bradyrhizobium sp. USDA 4538]MCP1905728.1 hypothetical protein [Bradyrhizobium sp. USDA 4537]MCP1988616.1 hypothetical protein [Bradyrhizobium sp. USDA 4539]MCP3418112.1 hypothetical protein [Bradyrhizobium brasilense]
MWLNSKFMVELEKTNAQMQCPKQTRRWIPLTALATGAFLAADRSAAAQEHQPGSDERPAKGDLLVLSEGNHQVEASSLVI